MKRGRPSDRSIASRPDGAAREGLGLGADGVQKGARKRSAAPRGRRSQSSAKLLGEGRGARPLHPDRRGDQTQDVRGFASGVGRIQAPGFAESVIHVACAFANGSVRVCEGASDAGYEAAIWRATSLLFANQPSLNHPCASPRECRRAVALRVLLSTARMMRSWSTLISELLWWGMPFIMMEKTYQLPSLAWR